MPREKETKNTPQAIIDQIVEKHKQGLSINELSVEYNKMNIAVSLNICAVLS